MSLKVRGPSQFLCFASGTRALETQATPSEWLLDSCLLNSKNEIHGPQKVSSRGGGYFYYRKLKRKKESKAPSFRRGPGSGMPSKATALKLTRLCWVKDGRGGEELIQGAQVPHFSHAPPSEEKKHGTDLLFLTPQPLVMAEPETFRLKRIWPLSRTRMPTYPRTFLTSSQKRKLSTLQERLYPKTAWPVASNLLFSAFPFPP